MKHPPERHWYLVAYDVSDDKRRAKVAKCLEGYGERIQYSVFRTFLSSRALTRLRWELSRKMDPLDGLLVIHLCPTCQGRIQDQHGKRDWRDEAPLGFRIAGTGFMHLPPDEPHHPQASEKTAGPTSKRKPKSMKAGNIPGANT